MCFSYTVCNQLVFLIDDISMDCLQDGEIMSHTHRFGSDAQAADGKFLVVTMY